MEEERRRERQRQTQSHTDRQSDKQTWGAHSPEANTKVKNKPHFLSDTHRKM